MTTNDRRMGTSSSFHGICGRGGGCAYLARYRQPAAVLGIDISPRAIAFCRRIHLVPGLSFRPGDAEALPCPAEAFDVVLNVESSHCYGSMPTFLNEVFRVLVPGGYFLWADLGSAVPRTWMKAPSCLCRDRRKSRVLASSGRSQPKVL